MAKNKTNRPDTSPCVFQREKIDFDLKIRELPWTEKQKNFITLATHKDTRVVFLSGPAGSSKTITAMRVALELLQTKRVSDIILVRAAIESSDEKLGFLPGDIDTKIGPYMSPFEDKLEEMLPKDQIVRLNKEGRLIDKPIGFCRGASWTSRCVILDEAQNITLREMKTLMTRMGKFSKMIVCADSTQSDLPAHKRGGYERCQEMFASDDAEKQGIFCVKFDKSDIVRSELCKFIVETFERHNA